MENKKILVLVGIPGSGKSTFANEFVKQNQNWVKLSRDDFIFALKNEYRPSDKLENTITELFYNSVETALKFNYNVILDNTHTKLSYINELVEKFNNLADIEFKLFDVDKSTALENDSKRVGDKVVGKEVINRMFDQLTELKKHFDFSPIPKKSKIFHYENTNNLPEVVIFDIDGTLAHMNGKRTAFEFHKVELDDLDSVVFSMYKMHKEKGDRIFIVSGREEICRKETEQWLQSVGVEYQQLIMRKEKDFRKDSCVKREIFESYFKDKFYVKVVYDDRNQVVDMWRKQGVKCFQVEPGNF